MPYVKPAPSLLDVCLKYVVENMDNEKSGYLDNLPPNLLIEIISKFKERKGSGSPKLRLLKIQPTSIKMTQWIESPLSGFLFSAIKNCKAVLAILSDSQQYFSSYGGSANEFFKSNYSLLTELRVIDLLFSADDKCLITIGKYCKELRVLNVSFCWEVTDVGIRGLCDSSKQSADDDEGGKCKLMRVLRVMNTQVSERGIQMALENLPGLEILDCDSIIHSLGRIHQNAVDQGLLVPKLNLIDLYYADYLHCFCTESRCLTTALLMCPLIQNLSLILSGGSLSNANVQGLCGLLELRALEIRGWMRCSFDRFILPVLKSIGSNLESLCLVNAGRSDIPSIIKFCPKLSSLTLFQFVPRDKQREELIKTNLRNPVLKELTSLTLKEHSSSYSDPCQTQELLLLLSIPNLEQVSICDYFDLTDEVLIKASKSHQFRHLKTLALHHCYQVTKRGIDALLTSTNPLEKITLDSCRSISRQDVDDWREKARLRNWKIDFTFEC